MGKYSKRQTLIREKVDTSKQYDVNEAIRLIKDLSTVKFEETIDVAINLGIDPRKSDQAVRGSSSLPNGNGKVVRVAVFASGDNAAAAEKAGADIVGMEDLASDIKQGKVDFDVVIADSAAMRIVGQLGRILGPRGLMPNPKTGTVTNDVATAVKNAKAGQVRFRADKGGIVHGGIARIGFETAAVKENLEALITDLKKAKPASSKGVYLKKVSLSSSMGPGLSIDLSSLNV